MSSDPFRYICRHPSWLGMGEGGGGAPRVCVRAFPCVESASAAGGRARARALAGGGRQTSAAQAHGVHSPAEKYVHELRCSAAHVCSAVERALCATKVCVAHDTAHTLSLRLRVCCVSL
eukprot:587127-Prymnesium_polylepis.1